MLFKCTCDLFSIEFLMVEMSNSFFHSGELIFQDAENPKQSCCLCFGCVYVAPNMETAEDTACS